MGQVLESARHPVSLITDLDGFGRCFGHAYRDVSHKVPRVGQRDMSGNIFSRKTRQVTLPLFSGLLNCPLCGLPALLLGRSPALLKRHGTHVVQRRVQSLVVVKRQPIYHLVHGVAACGKPFPV